MNYKKILLVTISSSCSLLQANIEVVGDDYKKATQNVGIIEIRNDTKLDFPVGLVIPDKGNAEFMANVAMSDGDRLNGRLKAGSYLRIKGMIDPKTRDIKPLNIKGYYTLRIYNPRNKTESRYILKDNADRKIIALVVEQDKDGNITLRAQKGNKAKAFLSGSGSSSGIHLNANILDEDIKKQ